MDLDPLGKEALPSPRHLSVHLALARRPSLRGTTHRGPVLRKLRPHLTYANVMVTLMAFVVFGGGSAYATHELILSSDIVDGEVKTPDLAMGAVTQARLADGAVSRNKLAGGAVIREKINNGAVDSSKVRDGSLTPDDLAAGANKSVVARVRGGTDVFTLDGETEYPTTGNTWTQAANESDQLFGEITYEEPECEPEPGEFLFVRAYLAGAGDEPDFSLVATHAFPVGAQPNQMRTEPLFSTTSVTSEFNATLWPIIFEPGVDRDRTLVVTVDEQCEGQSFEIHSIKINVAAIR